MEQETSIAANINKPNGIFMVEPKREFIINFTQKFQVRKVNGIGPVTEQKLRALEINLVKDIYEKRVVLYQLFQEKIEFFLKVYLGLGGENRAKKKT